MQVRKEKEKEQAKKNASLNLDNKTNADLQPALKQGAQFTSAMTEQKEKEAQTSNILHTKLKRASMLSDKQ